MMDYFPSWSEWQNLSPDQKEYHEYHWKKGVNDRLDCLERAKWQSKLLVFWGSFTGAAVTIGGFLVAKINIF